MSRADYQRTYNFRRRLPKVRGGIFLIWIEDSSLSSSLSNQSNETIARINASQKCHIIRYTSTSKCIRYLKRARIYERIIIVMVMNDYTAVEISRFNKYSQIQSIIIVSPGKNNTDDIPGEIIKQVYIFSDHQLVFDKLQQLKNDEQQTSDDDLSTMFDSKGKALRDVRQHLSPFVWIHSYTVHVMLSGKCSPNAEDIQLIITITLNWQKSLILNTVIVRPMLFIGIRRTLFLHMIINEALRTKDPRVLYIYRFYIIDLYRCLEETTLLTRKRQRSPFRVYRGSNLDRDEVEKLRVGMLAGTNGFFSSSLCLEVAKMFIGIDPITDMSASQSRLDRRQFVLFEVDVDLNQTSELIVADVSEQSNYPEEKEILFGLGTTFIINEITYDAQHYVWYVRMVASSEMAELKQEYTKYIHECLIEYDATTLFGNFLSEASHDYPAAMTYLQCHLRKMSFDNPYRPNVYCCLARVYRHMGRHREAIEYFRRAKLLQKRLSLQSPYGYARVLSELANAYSELNETAKAMSLHEQAIVLFCRILGANHKDMPVFYTRLAYVYWQRKRYDDAHTLLAVALSVLKEKGPSNFNGLGLTMHTMGLVKCALGQREESVSCLKEAIEIRRKLLPDDHPLIACLYYDLSLIYIEVDDKQAALQYAKMALTIRQAKLSKNHTELKRSLDLVERLLPYQ